MIEEEKLKAMNDNAELALEFTKYFNENIKLQVPKECAALAALHDLANWKDQHPRKGLWDSEKVCKWIEEHSGDYMILENDEEGELQSVYYQRRLIEDLHKAMED